MFLQLDEKSFLAGSCLIDVRSPAEFAHAHIPGAINIPLFSDEERARVGTCYKQVGKNPAFLLGLRFVVPKLRSLASQLRAVGKCVHIYCARGGLRSQSVARFARVCGLQVSTLKGGYKVYRRWVLNTLAKDYDFRVLGGFTGTGKTRVLAELRKDGAQVVDLEYLASHRGSAFGLVGTCQPGNEAFENSLAAELSQFDSNRPIWLEDESRQLGKCRIPDDIYRRMQVAPVTVIERTDEERYEVIYNDYKDLDPEKLVQATQMLSKRLGLQLAKQTAGCIEEGDYLQALKNVLSYYDTSYRHCLKRRKAQPTIVDARGLSFKALADVLRKGEKQHA